VLSEIEVQEAPDVVRRNYICVFMAVKRDGNIARISLTAVVAVVPMAVLAAATGFAVTSDSAEAAVSPFRNC